MPTAIWNVRSVTPTRWHCGFRRLPRAAADRVRADLLERGRCGRSGRALDSAADCLGEKDGTDAELGVDGRRSHRIPFSDSMAAAEAGYTDLSERFLFRRVSTGNRTALEAASVELFATLLRNCTSRTRAEARRTRLRILLSLDFRLR